MPSAAPASPAHQVPHPRLQSFRPKARPTRPEPQDQYGSVFDSGSEDDEDLPPLSKGLRPSSKSSTAAEPPVERLAPEWAEHPPHGTDTISLLLQHTDAYAAIYSLARAIRLLDRASRSQGQSTGAALDAMDPVDAPGPHDTGFATLRAFFDARYDSDGNLITPPYPGAHTPASEADGLGYAPRRRRATDALQTQGSAPQNGVHVVASNGSGAKTVRFPIRLDLHNVGLAPIPPGVRVARHRAARDLRADTRSPPHMPRSRNASRNVSATPAVTGSIPEHAVASPVSGPVHGPVHARASLPPLATPSLPPNEPSMTILPMDMAPGGLAGVLPWALPPSVPSHDNSTALTEEEITPVPRATRMRRDSSFTTVASGTSATSPTAPPHTINPPPGASNKDKDRRPSFLQRVLDIGLRHKTRSSSFASGHPPSSTEHHVRRGSVPAQCHGSLSSTRPDMGLGQAWDKSNRSQDSLGMVDETGNSDLWSGVAVESEAAGGSVFDDGPADEPPFTEGDDLITLLRHAATAAHTILTAVDELTLGDGLTEDPATVARDLLLKLADDRWLEGPLDPNPVVVAGALGLALGWEGIMDLCYGPGSRADFVRDFVALGRAAAIHRAVEEDQAKIINWAQHLPPARPPEESYAPAPDILPDPLPQEDTEWDNLSLDEVYRDLDRLDPETRKIPRKGSLGSHSQTDDDGPRSWLKKIRERVTHDTDDSGPKHGLTEELIAAHNMAQEREEAAAQGTEQPTRTWQDWMGLFRSLAGWIAEYESVRAQTGLAMELLPSKNDLSAGGSTPTNMIRTPSTVEGAGRLLPSVPVTPKVAPADLDTNAFLPPALLADLACSTHTFRRRPGMPDSSVWSQAQLSTKYISSPLTLLTHSLENQTMQLASSTWTARSGWELEYLDMCVFHSPVVAQRFPAPPAAAVRAGQAFCPPDAPAGAQPQPVIPAPASHMADGGSSALDDLTSAMAGLGTSTPPRSSTEGEQAQVDVERDSAAAGSARANLCPMPTPEGAWTAKSWRIWLAGVHEGQILVPAVAWQAWWTLIAILNGADRSGRSYDLQVKSFEEPFAALTDPKSVYI